MESLAPPLNALLEVRWEMENGNSFRESLKLFISKEPESNFVALLRQWYVKKTRDQTSHDLIESERSLYRRTLLGIFENGWAGEPILESLQELELELILACQLEMDEFTATLPFKALLPLLFLQFPAYLILLLTPIVSSLIDGLGAR